MDAHTIIQYLAQGPMMSLKSVILGVGVMVRNFVVVLSIGSSIRVVSGRWVLEMRTSCCWNLSANWVTARDPGYVVLI